MPNVISGSSSGPFNLAINSPAVGEPVTAMSVGQFTEPLIDNDVYLHSASTALRNDVDGLISFFDSGMIAPSGSNLVNITSLTNNMTTSTRPWWRIGNMLIYTFRGSFQIGTGTETRLDVELPAVPGYTINNSDIRSTAVGVMDAGSGIPVDAFEASIVSDKLRLRFEHGSGSPRTVSIYVHFTGYLDPV